MEQLKKKAVWVARGDTAANGKRPIGKYAAWKENPVMDMYEVASSYDHFLAMGVGIILEPPLVAIDLDKVLVPDSEGYAIAHTIVEEAHSWTEASQSRTGLHILGYYHGEHRGQISQPDSFKDEHGYRIEIFCNRHHLAYTGLKLKWLPDTVNDITLLIDKLWSIVEATGGEATVQSSEKPKLMKVIDGADFTVRDVVSVKNGSQACPWCGAKTGHNFDYNEDKDLWVCHHGGRSGGNAWMALAVDAGIISCKEAKKGALRGLRWVEVMEVAKKRGFIAKRSRPKLEEA